MKMFHFRGSHPNFGDELNLWLWPKLIPALLDNDEAVLFLGIGSILYDNFDPAVFKVVFGAGFGGYTPPPRLDQRWYIYCVRGPRTARLLGLDPALGLGDAGTLIRAAMPPPVAKRYRIAFIPHYESMIYGVWPEVAAQAGLHLIDPRWPVETVLDHMLASEVLLCEAMHGAIIADALRIPWIAVQPIMRDNRAKWHDWADTLALTLRPAELPPSTWLEWARQRVEGNREHLRRLSLHGLKLQGHFNGLWIQRAARALAAAACQEPQLSTDAAIERVTEAMVDRLQALREGRHLDRLRVPDDGVTRRRMAVA
jgi:exopolysaccharide glucosyl ketal-pyruvate-transferase